MEGILLSHRRASLVARSPHSLRSIGWRGIQDQERDGRARQFYGALALRIRLVADLLAGGNLPIELPSDLGEVITKLSFRALDRWNQLLMDEGLEPPPEFRERGLTVLQELYSNQGPAALDEAWDDFRTRMIKEEYKKARVAWAFVDGFPTEFEREEEDEDMHTPQHNGQAVEEERSLARLQGAFPGQAPGEGLKSFTDKPADGPDLLAGHVGYFAVALLLEEPQRLLPLPALPASADGGVVADHVGLVPLPQLRKHPQRLLHLTALLACGDNTTVHD